MGILERQLQNWQEAGAEERSSLVTVNTGQDLDMKKLLGRIQRQALKKPLTDS
ncbi:hypothetical protein [Thiolapillus sp.]|uniref:hypothetical protein n=1 Tax=Thiolapillus sp. TaxID=2017437 RepID=UPI0025EB3825|nr:hypothetical protein [Thiolapillus sp.]